MFRNYHRNSKGFTLIELMIVVVIIGILAALAIPRFMRSTTKSKQSEAKQLLKQIYTMQRAYRQEFNTYACNGVVADSANTATLAVIGVDVMTNARYSYTVAAGPLAFTATANATGLDDDGTPDTWVIDQTGNLRCTSDDAVN
jgi:prepilin-type N-terminal cleavage/methylation domain-containing protein